MFLVPASLKIKVKEKTTPFPSLSPPETSMAQYNRNKPGLSHGAIFAAARRNPSNL